MSDDPSAWRNFRKPNAKPRRSVGRPRKSQALTPFYGYPAAEIAEWCAVKLSTAQAYKSGRLKPGASVLKLWRLHVDGQVIPPGWCSRGFRFERESLLDSGGRSFHPGLLQVHALMCDMAHELSRRTGDPRDVERVWELLKAA